METASQLLRSHERSQQSYPLLLILDILGSLFFQRPWDKPVPVCGPRRREPVNRLPVLGDLQQSAGMTY